MVDDPVGGDIGDGTFQSVAHGDEDLSFSVPGLRGNCDHNAIVEFGIADAPFASDTGREIEGRLPAKVRVGDDHNAVGRGVVERADRRIDVKLIIVAKDVRVVIDEGARRPGGG